MSAGVATAGEDCQHQLPCCMLCRQSWPIRLKGGSEQVCNHMSTPSNDDDNDNHNDNDNDNDNDNGSDNGDACQPGLGMYGASLSRPVLRLAGCTCQGGPTSTHPSCAAARLATVPPCDQPLHSCYIYLRLSSPAPHKLRQATCKGFCSDKHVYTAQVASPVTPCLKSPPCSTMHKYVCTAATPTTCCAAS